MYEYVAKTRVSPPRGVFQQGNFSTGWRKSRHSAQSILGISSYPFPPPVWYEVDCEKLGEIYFADY
jgi:hypothetical protein